MNETNATPKIRDSNGRRSIKIKKKIKKTIIWGGIIIAIVAIFALIGSRSQSANQNNQTGAGSSTEGQMAPDFSLPSATGTTITLSSFRDKQSVLIYFHEGLTCDPCLQQMPELDKYIPEFDKMNVKLLYVAMDSPDDMKKSVGRYNIRTPVLSYMDARTEKDYNLLPYSMGMGRRAGHTFVLVGTDGKILWRKDYWPSVGMSVPGGKMFVPGSEILSEVQRKLGST